MNTTNVIGVGLILLVVLGGIFFAYNTSTTSNQTAISENSEAMMEESGGAMMEKTDEAMVEKSDDVMMVEDGAMMEKKDDSAITASAGTYAAYSADKLAMAEDGDVVLFFKAAWCPSCRALDADIKSNTGSIPAGVTILEVDFDSSRELRQQYGVTTQHTLVQVDANGDLVKKWSGGNTLESALAEII